MNDFLDKLASKKSSNQTKRFKKQLNKNTAPKQSRGKVKTIGIDYGLYRRLKIMSAIKDEQLGQLANIAIKYSLDHKIFK